MRKKFIESFWIFPRNVRENLPGFTGIPFCCYGAYAVWVCLTSVTSSILPSSKKSTVSAEEVNAFESSGIVTEDIKRIVSTRL